MTKKEQLFQYLVENSFEAPPTVRELCEALSIKSTSTVYNLLHSLEEDGLITIAKGKRRNSALVGQGMTVKIPLVGTVAAGTPILAQQNIETYITCEMENATGELFALRVKGDSMIDAGILDGDIIVARRVQTAENGEIVVALV
jgi:repressor LexA